MAQTERSAYGPQFKRILIQRRLAFAQDMDGILHRLLSTPFRDTALKEIIRFTNHVLFFFPFFSKID